MIVLAVAHAMPVVCDPSEAARLLEESGIPARRVPVVAPTLLPGLLRDQVSGPTRERLDVLCADPEIASLTPDATWEAGSFSAYTFTLARSVVDGCALVQESATLTVGVRGDLPPTTSLLAEHPPTLTPIGDCPEEARFREETVLDGTDGPVRLVLQVDVRGETRTGRVLVRRATPTGWHEQVLVDPAPAHLLGGRGGPRVTLTSNADPWIVLHHDSVVSDGACRALPGQTLWRWDGRSWQASTGREALGRLADRGLWRLASDDGWFLVVAQDDPSDLALLEARTRKRQAGVEERLTIRESGRFPLMNAGFLFAAPDPWPDREAVEAVRRDWPRKTGVYVRHAWEAADPCALKDGDATPP